MVAVLLFNVAWLCLAMMHIIELNLQRIRIRRWWVRPHLMEGLRNRYGAYATIFEYFQLHDEEEFYYHVGMPFAQFQTLFGLVRHRLTKYSRRGSLSPELRLVAVLHFLVHKTAAKTVAWNFLIGRSTMYKLVPEVCRAICESLMPRYMRFPRGNQDWARIIEGFLAKHDFPNCLGVLDGKHFEIKCPPNSGALFWNWKGFYSVNVMAICDSDGHFFWVSTGAMGSQNDSTVFRLSSLGRALYANRLPVVNNLYRLPNSEEDMSLFFIADGGFSLESFLMKPFQRVRNMPDEHRIFNFRLGKARRTIERNFGILTRKFRIFGKPLDFNLETINYIIMAAFCLHNFLLKENENIGMNHHRYGDDDSDDDSDSADDSERDCNYTDQSSDDMECSQESESTSSGDGLSEGEDEEENAGSDAFVDSSSSGSHDVPSAQSDSETSDASSNTSVEESSANSDNESSNASCGMSVEEASANSDNENSDARSDMSVEEPEDPRQQNLRARRMRDILTEYFTSRAGNVRWQWLLL